MSARASAILLLVLSVPAGLVGADPVISDPVISDPVISDPVISNPVIATLGSGADRDVVGDASDRLEVVGHDDDDRPGRLDLGEPTEQAVDEARRLVGRQVGREGDGRFPVPLES